MKNPTVEQVNFVIGRLQLVREQANEEHAFDMREGRVYDKQDNHKYECGTAHCVGGWYAVANLGRKFIDNKIKNGFVDFTDGADLMARDLGFADHLELQDWAYKNSRIWGNENGDEMFDSLFPYGNEGFDGVITQWELVKKNLIKLEEEK
jgi:hypothetical protein